MGRGKRRQVQQSLRQGCCPHAQTHPHTLRPPCARRTSQRRVTGTVYSCPSSWGTCSPSLILKRYRWMCCSAWCLCCRWAEGEVGCVDLLMLRLSSSWAFSSCRGVVCFLRRRRVSCRRQGKRWRSCQAKTRSWYEAAGTPWARTKFPMASSCFPGNVLR